MTVMEAIAARKSIRRYEQRPVEEEKLARVLEAGRLAPSASNRQAWKFIAVTSVETRRKLVDACGGQAFVGQAPVVLVICATDERMMPCGQPAHTVDCSIALSFMMLEAAQEGLGTCWLGNFQEERVGQVLGLPSGHTVVAVCPMGYPAEEGRPRSRKEPAQVIVKQDS